MIFPRINLFHIKSCLCILIKLSFYTPYTFFKMIITVREFIFYKTFLKNISIGWSKGVLLNTNPPQSIYPQPVLKSKSSYSPGFSFHFPR